MKENQKIIILVGISGVGKSTWCSNYINTHTNVARVNRDSIRQQLVGTLKNYYTRSNIKQLEKTVTNIQEENIKSLLDLGYDVIIDNTNLQLSIIIDFVIKYNHRVDIELKWFDKSPSRFDYLDSSFINDCGLALYERDSLLGIATVDRFEYTKYLNKQFHQYVKLKSEIDFDILKKTDSKVVQNHVNPCIISDLDGTLCLYGDNNPYDRDFSQDILNKPVYQIISNYYWERPQVKTVIFFSGRSDKFESVTRAWLTKNLDGIPYELYMRKHGDTRKDSIIKYEMYMDKIKHRWSVNFVIDDRLSVLEDCWEKLGIFCMNVNQGNIRF